MGVDRWFVEGGKWLTRGRSGWVRAGREGDDFLVMEGRHLVVNSVCLSIGRSIKTSRKREGAEL